MDVRQITPVDGDLGNLFRRIFAKNRDDDYIKVDGCILPERYKQFADEIENFQVRDDDVWVCSFPRTGTTWTQEMVWSIANDLDFKRAKVNMDERFPWFEYSSVSKKVPVLTRDDTGMNHSNYVTNSIRYVRDMPSPRFIKTHLPIHLLPRQLRLGEKKPKVVYVTRNAKDTCVSLYHFRKLLSEFEESFEDFASLFLGDTVLFGSFWAHMLGFWNKRNDDNLLFLKYDDMEEDLSSVIKKTATFLGKKLTNEQVFSLTDHLSFVNMKVNPAVAHKAVLLTWHQIQPSKPEGAFIRSGTTGQSQTFMTPELIKRFDDWTDEHLDGTELSFQID